MSTTSFWMNVGSNLVAGLIASVLVACFWVAVALPAVLGRRRRASEFFGLSRGGPRLVVYHSTLFVRLWGSVDYKGIERSYKGEAIPAREVGAFTDLVAVFHGGILDRLPPAVRAWLTARLWWLFGDMTPVLRASPRETTGVGAASVVCLGSPGYNSVTAECQRAHNPFLEFVLDEGPTYLRVGRGPRKGEALDRKRGDARTAVVQKLSDKSSGVTAFVVAGHGEEGTVGAAQYLFRNWPQLHREFRTRPFGLYLLVRSASLEPGDRLDVVEIERFIDPEQEVPRGILRRARSLVGMRRRA